jgi:deoxyribonuclease V
MILALDVHYKETGTAKAVGAVFDWYDSNPKEIITEYLDTVNEYEPGKFYKRELPCLLEVIERVNLTGLEAIIIDGYVFIDNDLQFGLGGILWEKLEKQIPIIGIAKTSFFKNKETVIEVLRGQSHKPLYVSAIDYPISKAVENISGMHGDYRIPTILSSLDQITKED